MATDKEEEIGTYSMTLVCSNCGGKDEVDIPKGQPVSIFLNYHRCPNCGCATMQRTF